MTASDLSAHLAELRAVIDDADKGPCSLDTVLWRLRVLYRLATDTNPWPEDRTGKDENDG